jgi:hypothetical protein
MKTKFGGRQRPHFIVKKWVQLGSDQPALAATTSEAAEPPKAEPLPGMKEVAEPTLKEQMKDEVPFDFDDPPDPDIPKTASPPVQPKPATTQTPPINKKGVQKIAGGRR